MGLAEVVRDIQEEDMVVGCPGWRNSSVVHRFVGLIGVGTRGDWRKRAGCHSGICLA